MVALFSDVFRPKIDGIAVSLEQLVNEFRRKGIEFDLFVPRNSPANHGYGSNIHGLLSLPGLVYPDLRFSLPLGPRTLGKLAKTKYRLIHSHTPGPTGVMALASAKLKRVPHFHTFHLCYPEYVHYLKLSNTTILAEWVNELCSWWGNQMDYIVVPSNKIRQWLQFIGVKGEIRVIPNGIDLLRFQSDRPEQSLLKLRRLIDQDDSVLLYVGRLAKEKSIDRLIVYFSTIVFSSSVKVKLVLVGDGPDRNRLEKVAEENGVKNNVVFLGFIEPSEMPSIYQAADVFTFLSSSETQGLVVLEAVASGLPVVVFNDLAYEGMVRQGENGFYVNDASSFASAVERLLRNQLMRSKFADESRKISLGFSIEKQVKDLLKYYEYGEETFLSKRGKSDSMPQLENEKVKKLSWYARKVLMELRNKSKRWHVST